MESSLRRSAAYRDILDHARNTNPFYSRWIPQDGDPPVLDRRTARRHNDEILNGAIPTGTTSGSLGIPFSYAHSLDWESRAKLDVERFVGQIGGAVPTVYLLPERHGPIPDFSLSVTAPLEKQVEFLLHHKDFSGVTAITTLPTNAELLSQLVLDRGIDTSFITRFGTMSETLQDYQKAAIHKAFPNARLWSTYSSYEFGFIATSCLDVDGFFHLMDHRLGVEVLREDGSDADLGEPGQIYITDYYNRLAPLIRYELGDIVETAECPCGKHTGLSLRRIHGRVAGTFTLRDGTRRLSANLSIAIRELPEVRQFQIVQESIEKFTVRVVADGDLDHQIFTLFNLHLGYRPDDLSVDYVDKIARGAGDKLRIVINRMLEDRD